MQRAIDHQPAPKQETARRGWGTPLLVGAFALLVIGVGVVPRLRAREELQRDTAALAVPAVSTLHARASTDPHEILLPATVKGFRDAAIFARTNGYLKRWYFDIGAKVKQGELLAEIETPEVDQQLLQARADLQTAHAALQLAKITAQRYAGLYKEQAIAKQDADNAAGDQAAKTAAVTSAEANVKRLQDLQSFQKVYAPFDGVLTARNVDVGNLVDSGASGGARAELFHIAQADKLRVYVGVPEIYAPVAKPGLSVDLTLREFPDRHFPGTLESTSGAIDSTTRTLLVQVAVDNPDGTLLPGAFAQVHFKLPGSAGALRVPATALIFRAEGLRVAVVTPDNKVSLVPINVARDLGTELEVSSGLTGKEAIIADPPDSLLAGQTVRVVKTDS